MDLTIEEATIIGWSKTVGQSVRAGEIILQVETDKAVVDVEAPASGILAEVLAGVGETVALGRSVGVIQPA